MLRIELVDALTAEGWVVVEASSGEHAFGRLARGEQFELLVTDIRLGGAITGWDVADEWRKRVPGAPLVYVSANDPHDTRRVEGSVFLTKPVVLSVLIETCQKLFTEHDT